jgi:hypothetical protein
MAKPKSRGFRCGTCGKSHSGLPTEWGFREPDVVFGLSYIGKYLRTRINADLCTLDESRYFLRGHLTLPFTEADGEFGWGLWLEVSKDHHDVYVAQMAQKAEGEPCIQYRLEGKIANSIPGYGRTLGVPVDVLLGEAGQRPSLWLLSRSRHPLAREQAGGISAARHHQLLEACGYFNQSG